MQETWVQPLGQEDPWRREWQPTPVFLPGESHGQGTLASYSPWCRKELDTTEVAEHTCTHKYVVAGMGVQGSFDHGSWVPFSWVVWLQGS